MAFTTRTLTHQFNDGNGNPSLGVVTFTLTIEMTNGADTVSEYSFDSQLVAGALSQAVTCNTDAGTVPIFPIPQWRVDIRIMGAPVQTFWITVAPGSTVDLFTLIPDEEQVG